MRSRHPICRQTSSSSSPAEFSLPGIDALGEREDDVDIEEID